MPDALVDQPEAVEVEEQHGDRGAAPLSHLEGLEHDVGEHPPVRQVGEAVVEGAVGELLLGPDAVRDVDHLGDQLLGPPGGVPHDGDGQVGPHHRAVGAEVPLLHAEAGRAVLDGATEQPMADLDVVGVADRLEGPPHQLVRLPAEAVGEGTVHLGERAVDGGDGHADRRALEREPAVGGTKGPRALDGVADELGQTGEGV